MADVQLEHGHVRVANRLLEAILSTDFSGAQMRIILALFRLTFGWRKRTVTISIGELATLSGQHASGGFRRVLDQLVANGVVLELKDGKALTYAIQKDYVKWGRFGGNEGRLAALWDRRPTSNDALLKASEEVADEDGPPQGTAPTEAGEVPPQGQSDCPHRDTFTGPKSLFGETVAQRKDNERQERQTTKPTATAAAADELHEYAIGLAVAANAAIEAKWGSQPLTIHFAKGTPTAERLIKAGIPLDLARNVIRAVVAKSNLEKAISSVSYFIPPIEEAYRDVQQRELNAADAKNQRGGAPRTINLVVNGDATKREAEREKDEYDAERRKAASAWANDPANSLAYIAICKLVDGQYADFGKDNAWVKKARLSEITFACADKAGFPDFETWHVARRGAA